jgi:uncharacterized membrane protein YdjX (TVP38/TMEM64 family)
MAIITEGENKDKSGGGSRKIIIFGAAVILLGFLVYNRAFFQELMRSSLEWIQDLGPLGSVVFVVVYILATIFFLPGSILTLGAGFVYGLIKGFVIVSIASTLGATGAFLVGRYLAREWVARKVEGNTRFRAIDEAVGEAGWRIVGLTRLSPVFPFNMLNYAYGLTKVSLRDYFLASWIGMMPGTVMYVYFGTVAGSLATLGTDRGNQTPAQLGIKIVGLVATIVVTVYITRIAKRALSARVEGIEADPGGPDDSKERIDHE